MYLLQPVTACACSPWSAGILQGATSWTCCCSPSPAVRLEVRYHKLLTARFVQNGKVDRCVRGIKKLRGVHAAHKSDLTPAQELSPSGRDGVPGWPQQAIQAASARDFHGRRASSNANEVGLPSLSSCLHNIRHDIGRAQALGIRLTVSLLTSVTTFFGQSASFVRSPACIECRWPLQSRILGRVSSSSTQGTPGIYSTIQPVSC